MKVIEVFQHDFNHTITVPTATDAPRNRPF